jgi:WD40 repeat protein
LQSQRAKLNEDWSEWKQLFFIETTSNKAWSNKPTPRNITKEGGSSSIYLEEGMIYLGGGSGVMCFDVNGNKLKEYTFPVGSRSGRSSSVLQVSNERGLVVACNGEKMHLWNFHTGQYYQSIDIPPGTWDMQFDSTKLVCSGEGSQIRMFDLETCKPLASQSGLKSGHNRPNIAIRSLSFDENYLATGGAYTDNTIKLWDFRDLRHPCSELTDWVSGIWCLHLSQGTLAAGSRCRAAVFDLRKENEVLWQADAHTEHINMIQFDDLKLVTGGGDKMIKVFDMDTFVERWAVDIGQTCWNGMYEANLLVSTSTMSNISVLNLNPK